MDSPSDESGGEEKLSMAQYAKRIKGKKHKNAEKSFNKSTVLPRLNRREP